MIENAVTAAMPDQPTAVRRPRAGTTFAAAVLACAVALLASAAQAGGPKPRPDDPPKRPPQNRKTFALKNVTVIDVATGTEQHDMTILVGGGRITGVGPAAKLRVPAGTRVIDAHGTFALPGLWDFDTRALDHSDDTFRLFVANGVTGVRDMDTARSAASLRDLRAAQHSGKAVGPRFVTALDRVDVTAPAPGAAADPAAVAETVRAAVRAHKTDGADFVSPGDGLDAAAYQALVDEAAKAKLPVAGAVPRALAALDAARAGQRTLDGLESIFRATSARGADLPARLAAAAEVVASASPEALKAFAADLATQKTVLCPMLVRWRGLATAPAATTRRDRRLGYILRPVRESWLPARNRLLAPLGPDDFTALGSLLEHAKSLVRALHTAGVPFVAGTGVDLSAPNVLPGFSIADELALLVDSGLTPSEALAAATLEPARLLGRERDLGAIATGKRADLVLFEADPLFAIKNLTRVRAVVADGTLFDHDDLGDQLALSAAPE